MNYVYLFLFFLLDAIFLQPLKIGISLIIKYLWSPSLDISLVKSELCTGNIVGFNEEELKSEIRNYDPTPLLYDGDGFKWLTILLGSMIGLQGFDTKREEILSIVCSYFMKHGTVGRYPIDCPQQRYYSCNFSGDMASGLLFWLAKELKFRANQFNDNSHIKEVLIKFFNNTTFDTVTPNKNKKNLLCFVNAQDEVAKYNSTTEDRGFIYRIYGLGPDMVRMLAWFRVGYELTGERRYWFFYKFLRIMYTPLLLVNTGDYGFFFKKIHAIAWYTCNSNMYCHTALHILEPDSAIEAAATALKNRHVVNADILSLWDAYFDKEYRIHEIFRPYPDYFVLIANAMKKGTRTYTGPVQKYFDIRKFKYVERPSVWCLPSQLGHKYLWENNPIDPTLCDDVRRQQFAIDRYVATLHMLRKM